MLLPVQVTGLTAAAATAAAQLQRQGEALAAVHAELAGQEQQLAESRAAASELLLKLQAAEQAAAELAEHVSELTGQLQVAEAAAVQAASEAAANAAALTQQLQAAEAAAAQAASEAAAEAAELDQQLQAAEQAAVLEGDRAAELGAQLQEAKQQLAEAGADGVRRDTEAADLREQVAALEAELEARAQLLALRVSEEHPLRGAGWGEGGQCGAWAYRLMLLALRTAQSLLGSSRRMEPMFACMVGLSCRGAERVSVYTCMPCVG